MPPLTELERRIGLGLAAAGAIAFVALSQGVLVLLAVGLTMTAGLGISSWRRRRVATAVFAFVTTFGPWVFLYVAGAPYAVYALWLLSGATRADRRNDSSSPRRRTKDRSVGS